jgi:hypothetical protein
MQKALHSVSGSTFTELRVVTLGSVLAVNWVDLFSIAVKSAIRRHRRGTWDGDDSGAWAAAAASSTPGAAAAAAAAGTRALGTRSVRTKSDIDSEWRPPSASASTATTARDAASTARSGGWGEGPPGIAQSGGAH